MRQGYIFEDNDRITHKNQKDWHREGRKRHFLCMITDWNAMKNHDLKEINSRAAINKCREISRLTKK